MPLLILGLLIFLGVHSLRLFADDWRTRMIARLGANAWKGLYALVAVAGFVLIVWGFGLARQHALLLYAPPPWLMQLNALFTLVAFVLVAAAYVPRNHLKAKIGHPMLAGVKVWALGHLLAIGFLHDVVLFGAFLLWAIADFVVSRRRDRRAGVIYPQGTLAGDALTLVIGIAAWAIFAFWLHARLIGVSPFGVS
ncbi:MAG TPA: NnrU family protein [Rhodanobacteraceae bacterium]|nr:NnrU family protein [Rhodanobacteraceae bacterium]